MRNVEIIDSFTFESGETLKEVPVSYSFWGNLNKEANNAILVCHSLTADTNVESWWPNLLASDGAFSTKDYFVICLNMIGSPYGSVSPLTINPHSRAPYGKDFPVPTIRDHVQLHKLILDKLKISSIYCAVGASLGAMQVLEWAIQYPDYIKNIIPIAVGASHSPWCIAFSEVQRQCIVNDSDWNQGDYDSSYPPKKGLGIARQIAMLSYRSSQSFQEKFGRDTDSNSKDYEVIKYLEHQDSIFINRFDANCYITLINSMDTHDIGYPDKDIKCTIRSISQKALVIGITSDILYPLDEQKFLADHLPNSDLVIIDYPHGHDTFLIELTKLNEIFLDWLQ